MTSDARYLFYRSAGSTAPLSGAADPTLVVELWRPRGLQRRPRDVADRRFLVWALFHDLRVFANRDYALLLIRRNGTLVHRSCVFPRYFRFPFMGRADLQIGDTWTAEELRGRGLAARAIREITAALGAPGRHFWYVVGADNHASIRVIEKCGFELVGEGSRVSRAGLNVLGCFRMNGAARSEPSGERRP